MAKPDLPVSNLATRLRDARNAAGLTQTQLGEKAKIGQSALSSIESGETLYPQAGTLLRIAAALEVEAHWLGTGQGPRGSEPSGPLHEVWQALDSNNRRALMDAAKGILAGQSGRKPR